MHKRVIGTINTAIKIWRPKPVCLSHYIINNAHAKLHCPKCFSFEIVGWGIGTHLPLNCMDLQTAGYQLIMFVFSFIDMTDLTK